jgi:large subunit ribosomal protein L15
MANELSNLKPPKGAHKKRMRVGRGEGSGKGKTSGRGSKGQRHRGTVPAWFEGGQMPLARRLAKRGFKNNFSKNYSEVRLDLLEKFFEDGATVNAESLLKANLFSKIAFDGVKVIGASSEFVLSKALHLQVAKCTKSVKVSVEAAAGTVKIDGAKFRPNQKKNKE